MHVSTSPPRPDAGPVLTVPVSAWSVLVDVVARELPDLRLPTDFRTAPGRSLTGADRVAAAGWLVEHDLADPALLEADAGPADLEPLLVAGLTLFALPGTRARVSATLGATTVIQSAAWDGERAVVLGRRGCTRDGATEPEGVVRLAFTSSAGLLTHLMRAVPAAPAGDEQAPGDPVEIGWHRSVALVTALRDGREDLAPLLVDLSPAQLGAVDAVTEITGTVDVAVHRVGGPGTPAAPEDLYRSVWLWTPETVVRILEASRETVVLRRSGRAALHTELLSVLATARAEAA